MAEGFFVLTEIKRATKREVCITSGTLEDMTERKKTEHTIARFKREDGENGFDVVNDVAVGEHDTLGYSGAAGSI